MEVEILKKNIENIVSQPISAQVFLLLKQDEQFIAKRADLENGKTETEVTKLFNEFILNKIVNNDELQLCELSTADERTNALYHYDYDEYPEELKLFKEFDINSSISNIDKFNFHKDNINSLYGYIIYLGTMENGIVLFKKHYSISLIRRDSFLLGIKKAKKTI